MNSSLLFIDQMIISYHDSQRQWGDLAAAIMAVSIGWSLDEDHDFDTLMGTILIGAVLLFLVSLSTTVIPADPALLGIHDDDQGDHNATTPLLKTIFDVEQPFSQTTTPATSCAFIENNTNNNNNARRSLPPTSPNTKDSKSGKTIPSTTPSMIPTTVTTNAIHTAVMSPYYEHRPPSTYFYKPYCLFNEQLSHISEEDASMLRRMASNTNTHLTMKQHQHQQATMATETITTTTTTETTDSVISESIGVDTDRGDNTDYTAGGATTTCCTRPFRSSSQYWATTTTTTASTTACNIHDEDNNTSNGHYLFSEMPSLQLALLPSPPSETPMLVLPIALTSTFIHNNHHHYYDHNNSNNNNYENNNEDEEQNNNGDETRAFYYYGSFNSRHNHNLWNPWAVHSLLLTVFLAGVGSSMMNALLYIYLHDGLGLPMHLIGIVGMVAVAAKVASKPLVHWAINRYSVVAVTGVAHVTLILCAFGYTFLQPDYLLSRLAAVILQILQGGAFNSLWLIAVRQVDCVLLTASQHQRMLLRGKMSALFNSLGPALGAIMSGFLVDACIHHNIMSFSGFLYSYRVAIVVLAFCWAISRGWTVVAEDDP
ncbi:hypothetical protein BDC45DRAFT_29425 [Circinella umbellata]|nr:hypothetical protein BDC45DRAFT_29425 [Circinella umbellata]